MSEASLYVYPLLFPLSVLTNRFQMDDLSCTDAVVLTNFYLKEMMKNISKYQIPNGKRLYDLIKKRLLLNKNMQLYHLASLLTLDGIILYRQLTISKVYKETVNNYFHSLTELAAGFMLNQKLVSVHHYKVNEHQKYMDIINNFYSNYSSMKRTKKSNLNTNKRKNKKQLSVSIYFKKSSSTKEAEKNDNNNSNDHSNISMDHSNISMDHSNLSNDNYNASNDSNINFDYDEEEEEEEYLEDLNNEYYSKLKDVYKFTNISQIILKNAEYFGLSEDEANKASIELGDLLSKPFCYFKEKCPDAICMDSKFSHFWSVIKDIEYEQGRNFSHIAKIAFILFSIPASEAGAERAFSLIKWRFNDRRNKVKKETMMNEIFIENFHKEKINSDKEYSLSMWDLPKE